MLIGDGEIVEHARGAREAGAGAGLGRANAEETERAMMEAVRPAENIFWAAIVMVGVLRVDWSMLKSILYNKADSWSFNDWRC